LGETVPPFNLGGDADTQGAIAGAVAEAHWGGLPPDLEVVVRHCLPSRMANVLDRFISRYRGR
jgi:ADP-ribosylglycohydrolase